MAFSIGHSEFRCASEIDCLDHSSTLCIDDCRTISSAVIYKNPLRCRIVNNRVRAFARCNHTEFLERLGIHNCNVICTANADECALQLWHQSNSVNTWRIRDAADNISMIDIEHDNLGANRYISSPGRAINRHVVPFAFAVNRDCLQHFVCISCLCSCDRHAAQEDKNEQSWNELQIFLQLLADGGYCVTGLF